MRSRARSAESKRLLDALACAGLDHGGRSHLRLIVSFDQRAPKRCTCIRPQVPRLRGALRRLAHGCGVKVQRNGASITILCAWPRGCTWAAQWQWQWQWQRQRPSRSSPPRRVGASFCRCSYATPQRLAPDNVDLLHLDTCTGAPAKVNPRDWTKYPVCCHCA
jgi:hypothetical protein